MEPQLLKILQLTRAQPMYGLIHYGVPTDEVSNLAEHHYLISMTAWAVAAHVEKAGTKVDYGRLFKLCLIHDLGELFGGDISMPYAKLNPEAKRIATEFEASNNRFLAQYFGSEKETFSSLSEEVHTPKSLEGIIMKIADYMEVQQFNSYKKLAHEKGTAFLINKIMEKIDSLEDANAKSALHEFIKDWAESLKDQTIFPYTN